jgi:hypothetical protein
MIDYSHKYEVTYPKVQIARANNKCRVCKQTIAKDEKYLECWYIDLCAHYMRNKIVHLNVEMKFCKKCSEELLKISSSNFLLRPKHIEKVMEAIKELKSGE